MPRHLEDHHNLNSRIFGSGGGTSLPLNSASLNPSIINADGATTNISSTTVSASALNSLNLLSHHAPNRSTLLSHSTDGAKPAGQRQPLALIQETVRSLGSFAGADMQTTVQYSQSSAYSTQTSSASLSQTNHAHNPSHHAPHQNQLHTSQVHSSNQHNSQSNMSPLPGQQMQFQRLKVEDALSYLDQVKYKFGNQPQVYNDFLDIMKEFKSQSIDTPGVIQRVSTLFKGHPELIVGFNTFLPPGYRIEVQSNEQVQVSIPGSNISGTGPTSLTINPGGTITTQPLHPTHGNHLAPSPHHSSSGNKVVNHQTSVVNNQTPKESSSQVPSSPAHTPSSGTSPGVHSPNSTPQANQPVEFNHAINYVNKIKNRFQGQPDIYKQFLEILHTYQKEQRNLKDGVQTASKPLTEAEVYAQVAKLFQNQEDLLQEFGQFLPDANGAANALVSLQPPKTMNNDHSLPVKKQVLSTKSTPPPAAVSQTKNTPTVVKRPSSSATSPPSKMAKMTSLRDVSLAEAGKSGTLNEFAFFDKVRKALKSQEVYENFLRLLILYNQEIISRADLVQLIAPFLSRFPELFKWFKDFLGYKESANAIDIVPNKVMQERERGVGGDFATEIDYSSCKKYGASYRAVPRNYVQPKCSGRTSLCKEVLNDTWVSFPSWSEDSTFVSSRKTQYEEYIYRCEDERFELDVVLDSNLSTVQTLEAVLAKMNRMSSEEKVKFRLDDSLGGNSAFIHQRAVKRLYGDKAPDVIEGLKKNPVTAVPLVLKRLKTKEEEWRKAQKSFNKMWRDQNEKYYLKSLDHQGIAFKQNDVKYLRSKSLLNEIENIYEERHEQADEGGSEVALGPHITVTYKTKDLFKDAANLVIHHVKRQTGMHKEDKHKIKQLIRQFVPDFYGVTRGELSDDEIDNDDMDIDDDNDGVKGVYRDLMHLKYGTSNPETFNCTSDIPPDVSNHQEKLATEKSLPLTQNVELDNSIPDDTYSLFFVNNNWYIFFRLHFILCERLGKIYERSQAIMSEELHDREERKKSTAIALRLKPKSNVAVEAYYSSFMDMIKSLLDQNIDANQFEDTLRELFGIEAYWAFTLEKVVQNIVRQLQHIVADESCTQCTSLFVEESKNKSTGGLCSTVALRSAAEAAYQKKAEKILSDENCYKVIIYKSEAKLTFELLDSESDQIEEPGEGDKWSYYFGKYAASGEDSLPNEVKEHISKWPVFLPRNVRSRRQRERNGEDKSSDKVISEEGDSPSYMTEGDLDSKIDLSCLEDSTAGDAVKGLVGLNQNSILAEKGRSKNHQPRSECKFDLNDFKLLYVVHSECVMFKKNSLRRARQFHKKVSDNLNKHFHEWHKKWLQDNVCEEDAKNCEDWLLGFTEDNKPTTCIKMDDLSKPPYYCYRRFCVEEKT